MATNSSSPVIYLPIEHYDEFVHLLREMSHVPSLALPPLSFAPYRRMTVFAEEFDKIKFRTIPTIAQVRTWLWMCGIEPNPGPHTGTSWLSYAAALPDSELFAATTQPDTTATPSFSVPVKNRRKLRPRRELSTRKDGFARDHAKLVRKKRRHFLLRGIRKCKTRGKPLLEAAAAAHHERTSGVDTSKAFRRFEKSFRTSSFDTDLARFRRTGSLPLYDHAHTYVLSQPPCPKWCSEPQHRKFLLLCGDVEENPGPAGKKKAQHKKGAQREATFQMVPCVLCGRDCLDFSTCQHRCLACAKSHLTHNCTAIGVPALIKLVEQSCDRVTNFIMTQSASMPPQAVLKWTQQLATYNEHTLNMLRKRLHIVPSVPTPVPDSDIYSLKASSVGGASSSAPPVLQESSSMDCADDCPLPLLHPSQDVAFEPWLTPTDAGENPWQVRYTKTIVPFFAKNLATPGIALNKAPTYVNLTYSTRGVLAHERMSMLRKSPSPPSTPPGGPAPSPVPAALTPAPGPIVAPVPVSENFRCGRVLTKTELRKAGFPVVDIDTVYASYSDKTEDDRSQTFLPVKRDPLRTHCERVSVASKVSMGHFTVGQLLTFMNLRVLFPSHHNRVIDLYQVSQFIRLLVILYQATQFLCEVPFAAWNVAFYTFRVYMMLMMAVPACTFHSLYLTWVPRIFPYYVLYKYYSVLFEPMLIGYGESFFNCWHFTIIYAVDRTFMLTRYNVLKTLPTRSIFYCPAVLSAALIECPTIEDVKLRGSMVIRREIAMTRVHASILDSVYDGTNEMLELVRSKIEDFRPNPTVCDLVARGSTRGVPVFMSLYLPLLKRFRQLLPRTVTVLSVAIVVRCFVVFRSVTFIRFIQLAEIPMTLPHFSVLLHSALVPIFLIPTLSFCMIYDVLLKDFSIPRWCLCRIRPLLRLASGLMAPPTL